MGHGRLIRVAARSCLLLAAVATVARGQPAPDPSPVATQEQKSPWVATGLAVGVTFGGVAIAAGADSLYSNAPSPVLWAEYGVAFVGAAAGPSAGHWYAGESGHAWRWTALRSVGLAAGIGGVYLISDYDRGAPFASGIALSLVGGSVYAVGLYWDLFDAHRAAARANQRADGARVVLVPMVGRAAGLQLVGSF
jgi:hypothetical protein